MNLETMTAREEAVDALRPVATRRHCVVRSCDPDRNDRDAVTLRDDRRTRPEAPQLACTRASALGKYHETPALLDEVVDVVERAAVHAPATAAHDRHGVEDQRDGVGDRTLVVEVVGGRCHRCTLP